MLNQPTVQILRELRLNGMATELQSQLETPHIYKNLGFEDRLGRLVEAEKDQRNNNLLTRRMKAAHFSDPSACIENIEYHPDRRLDQGQILRLATCDYIKENHHVVLRGATGAGKTYIANALGNAACRKYLKVKYMRLPDLLSELTVSKNIGTYEKVKLAYTKLDLLIIDEWLLRPLPAEESYELLEIIDACYRKGALIICSQFDIEDWYFRLDCNRGENQDSTVAEAILDRIVHNKYDLFVDGAISMRKRHAFSN